MNNLDQLIGLYEELFSVGSLRRNIALYIISYVIYFLFIYVLAGTNYILYLWIPLYSLIYNKLFIKYLLGRRDDEFLCMRRLLALHVVENAIIILLIVIQQIASITIFSSVDLITTIYLGVSVYESIILTSTLYQGERRGNLLITTKILILILILYLVSPSTGIISILGFIAGLTIGNISVYLINRNSKKFTREGILEYLRGYIDAWLLDDPSKLDQLIYKNSLPVKIPIDLIVFPGVYRRTAQLVIPYFHFGPFKNVGSSRFPSIAGEYTYVKNGFLTGVFHGPSTHDRDLASNSEMNNILNRLVEYKEPIIFNEISDLQEIRNGKATVKYMRLDDSIILFLEYEEMEDIPYEVVDTLKNIGSKMGYANVIVVDTHNSLINKRYALKDEDISLILKTGIEALEEAKTSITQKFKVAVEKIELPKISLKDGLGSNGIYMLVLETLTKRNAILIIDSNNLHPKLKEKLEKVLLDNYFDNIVVTTTDTHEVTALELVEGGYKIIGADEEVNDYIVGEVSKIAGKLITRLKNTDGHIYSVDVDTHVIGFNLLDKLSMMTINSFKLMKKIFLGFTIPITLLIMIAILIT